MDETLVIPTVVKKKGVKMTYFVIVLANKSAISDNSYTELVLLDKNYNAQSECISLMSPSVLDYQNYDVCLKIT